jgi:hypothetical protein
MEPDIVKIQLAFTRGERLARKVPGDQRLSPFALCKIRKINVELSIAAEPVPAEARNFASERDEEFIDIPEALLQSEGQTRVHSLLGTGRALGRDRMSCVLAGGQ